MAIDTPAHLVIVGAGPVGLEAALYGRFLGYDVTVLERNSAAHRLRVDAASTPLPFGQAASPLGIAALRAQDAGWNRPGDEEQLDGGAWIDRYYGPLARTDLLADQLSERCTVVEVQSVECEADSTDDERDSDELRPDYLVVARSHDGRELQVAASAVLLATGQEGAGVADRPTTCEPLRLPPSKAAWFSRGMSELDGPAPDIYVLGGASAADKEKIAMADGLAQIRRLFARLADRPGLDLYANLRSLAE